MFGEQMMDIHFSSPVLGYLWMAMFLLLVSACGVLARIMRRTDFGPSQLPKKLGVWFGQFILDLTFAAGLATFLKLAYSVLTVKFS